MGGVQQKVGASSAGVGNSVGGGNRSDEVGQLSGADGGEILNQTVAKLNREDAGNVGRSHGSSGDGVGGGVGADPSSLDVLAGGEDVEAGSPVGEGSTGISRGLVGVGVQSVSGGSDGVGREDTSRGEVASVTVVVSTSNGVVDTGSNGGSNSGISSGGNTSTKGHVGNRGAATGGSAVGSPLNTLNDTGPGSRTTAAEHLDGDEGGLLGNTVVEATGGGGNVGSVSVAVRVGLTRDGVDTEDGTALEVLVGQEDTGVDDVGVDASAGRLPVSVGVVVEEEVAELVNSAETPGCGIGLDLLFVFLEGAALVVLNDGDNVVGLNPLDERIGQKLADGVLVELGGVTGEDGGPSVDDLLLHATNTAGGLGKEVRDVGVTLGNAHIPLENDHVLVRNNEIGVGDLDERSGEHRGNEQGEEQSDLHVS